MPAWRERAVFLKSVFFETQFSSPGGQPSRATEPWHDPATLYEPASNGLACHKELL
jgi:hypothetical protein